MQPELEPGQVGRVCRPEMVKPKMYVLKTESKRGWCARYVKRGWQQIPDPGAACL